MKNRELKEFIQQVARTYLREDIGTGVTTLYHYSRSANDTLLLDPERVGSNPHSKREMNTSDVPRVFFYTDPKQREQELFGASHNLFIAKVPSEQIYDLKQDPLKLFQEYGRHGIHEILMFLSGWTRKTGKWLKLPSDQKHNSVQNIKGAMYDLGRFKVVIWFEPIIVKKISSEEKAELEKSL
jgi:hypothetical protein